MISDKYKYIKKTHGNKQQEYDFFFLNILRNIFNLDFWLKSVMDTFVKDINCYFVL